MNNILASFIFFTRLPFWKIKEVPAECFKHVVPYWPLTGWLTGGLMAGALWLSGQILPVSIAWIIAVIVRLLVTGCLHEDGLADFLDGFGGGTTRERTLAIMKDSHIGSYGVIGLIFYFLLLLQMRNLPLNFLCILVFCGDIKHQVGIRHLPVGIIPFYTLNQQSFRHLEYAVVHGIDSRLFMRVVNGRCPGSHIRGLHI